MSLAVSIVKKKLKVAVGTSPLPDTATGVTCTARTQKHKLFAKLHVTQVFLIFQEGNLTFPHSRVVCTCITRNFQYYVEWFQ